MKYCSQCPADVNNSFLHIDLYCTRCKSDLTPCIQCLCGSWHDYNPKNPREAKACPGCGERFTPEYLGKCMRQQLAGMVREIAQQHSVGMSLN